MTKCSPDSDQALVALVDRFSKRLLAKLRLAHANGRRGWEKNDWEKQCQEGLLRHIEKGDPRDVAAYCAFMDHHGWITKPATPTAGGDEAATASEPPADIVDQVAQWLHDETGHPDSYPDYTWPETDRDDGQREGGFVKIVPLHAQAYFRDIARRMVSRFIPDPAQPSLKTAQGE